MAKADQSPAPEAPVQPGTGDHYDERDRKMSRGVSQLLFTYLPGRVVDWEDGAAIVELTQPRLSSVWPDDRARLVLGEVTEYLEAWKQRGGRVHHQFPDPQALRPRLVVGEPASIAATPLPGALICRRCARLVFRSARQLQATGGKGFICPSCHKRTLRQFGQVFVHGCGELVVISEYLPWMKEANGAFQASYLPLKCNNCGPEAVLEIPARSERARDMSVICRRCKHTIFPRLYARCPSCVKELMVTSRSGASNMPAEPDGVHATAVARVAMRLANSRANDAYYPHTLSLLRLDRPPVLIQEDAEIRLLTGLLPASRRPEMRSGGLEALQSLMKKLEEATKQGDATEAERIRKQIATAALSSPAQAPVSGSRPAPMETDVVRSVEESLAFRTQVSNRIAEDMASELGVTGVLLAARIDRQR